MANLDRDYYLDKDGVQTLVNELETNTIANEYSSSATYAVGDYCIHDNKIYRCTTKITTAESWTSGHWSLVVIGDELKSKKSGTVTSVTIKGTSPITVDNESAITQWGTRTISLGTVPIANGGTGATTALGATDNLGAINWASQGTILQAGDNVDTDLEYGKTYYSPSSTISQALAGTPPVTNSGFKIIQLMNYQGSGSGVAYSLQIATASGSHIYIRYYKNGTPEWDSWAEIYNSWNLTSKSASSGGTAVSLVTTGEKYTWNNKADSNDAVKQQKTTSANYRKVLLGYTEYSNPDDNPSTTVTNQSYVGTNLSYQASTGTLLANKFLGEVPEAYLTWGGKDMPVTSSPMDAAFINEMGNNRFAYMPASSITVEYTRDGGTTWTDYGATDNAKVYFLLRGGDTKDYLYIGKADNSNKATAHGTDYQLRVTVDMTGNLYTVLSKFAIYKSLNGSADATCKVQGALGSAPNTFVDLSDDVSINSDWTFSVININQITVTDKSTSNQYAKLRFIFKANGGDTTKNGMCIIRLYAFGRGYDWTMPSSMARSGHLYRYEPDQSAIFPKDIRTIGDVITEGNLKVGTPASDQYFPAVGIYVHDTRNVDTATIPTMAHSANFFFTNNGTPSDSTWWAGLAVRGWGGTFSTWELIGPAGNSNYSTVPLYVRTSNKNTAWGDWRKIYDDANPPTATETGALADTTKYALSDSVGGDALNAKKVNNLTVQTAVPASAVFTDKKVTAVATDPTTQTSYYPIYVTGATNQQPGYSAKSGYAYTIKNGTASADGWCSFKIGNTTASGSADNMKGILTLCSSGTKYTDIVASASITANTTVTLPSSTGTLALTSEVADKMDKVNPTGTGSLSLNRKANTTIGDYSSALGLNCEASGNYSHAEGQETTSSGLRSHAEGRETTSSGQYGHAEGYQTTASGQASHAEGSNGVTASGIASHAEGYGAISSGAYSHAEGYTTVANHRSQHVFGEYNVADPSTAQSTSKGNYVEIVGNGSSTTPSNARTLDWSGNEVLSGYLQTTAIYSNTGSSPGTSGGLSLYTTNAPDIYGIAMRTTASLGKHGCVQGDYATYYNMRITTYGWTRGWIFRGGKTDAFANVASINVDGDAAFNGSVTIGANTTNTSGCRLTYNSTTKSCDFVFV